MRLGTCDVLSSVTNSSQKISEITLESVGVQGGWIENGTTGREEDYIYFYVTGKENKRQDFCLRHRIMPTVY
jgi:hypothetical protein